MIHPHTDRVVDGVGDGGNRWMQRPLPRFLGAVRTLRIDGLDDERFELRCVETRGDAVVEE